MLLALSGRICYCNSQLAGNTEGSAAAVGVAFLCSNAPLNAGDCTLPTQSVLAQHHCMGVAVLGMAHGDHIVNTDGHTVIQFEHTGVISHHGELALVGSGQLSVAGGDIEHIDAAVRDSNGNSMAVHADLRAGNSAVIIAAAEVCSSSLLDLCRKGQVGLLLIRKPAGNINIGLLACSQLVPGGSTGNHTGSGIVVFGGNGALHPHIADSGSDDGGAVAGGGDLAVLIHSGNGIIRRCPLDDPAGCLRRHNGRNQGHGITDPQMFLVAVEQDAADSGACLHFGNCAGDKVEAVLPGKHIILQDDARAGIGIVGNRNGHGDSTVVIGDNGNTVPSVVGGSVCHTIGGNILSKAITGLKSHIDRFGAFFDNYLVGRNIPIVISSNRVCGNVHQVTVLIVFDIQELAAFIVAAKVCAAGALLAHHNTGNSGGNFCRLLVGGVGVQRQQEVHTVFLRHIHSNGIGGSTVIVQRGDFFPIAVIQNYLHTFATIHRNKVLRSSGSAPLLGLNGNTAAAFCHFINVFIEGGKIAGVVESPVGKHSHINGIAVRQQDIVRGRTPAGTHVGVAVIAVVHQVAIVTPELVHKDAGSTAGIHKCLVVSAIIGQLTAHIVDVVFLGIFQNTGFAGTALLFGQAHIVPLQQIDVQMQAGGSANNGAVHIGTSAAVCTVAVILCQAVQIQLEVRNCNLQIGQHTVIGFQGHTVIGYSHINSNGRLVGLIVAILLLDTLIGRIHSQLDSVGDLAALALSSQHQIIGLTLRTLGGGSQVQYTILQLGKHRVCGAVEAIVISDLVAVSFSKHIAHLQLIQATGLCSSRSRCVTLDGQASSCTIHKLNIVCCAEGCRILHGYAVDLTVAVFILHSNFVAVGRSPAGGAFTDVVTCNIIVGPLHFRLKV